MARTAILAIKIISDATSAAKGLDSAAGGVSKFERGMGKAAAASSVVVASLAGLGKAAFDEASNLQQAKGAVEAVFKAQAPAINALAANAAEAVGLAESEYSSLAAGLGGQLKSLGTAQDQLVPSTEQLISTAADLASMYGGTTADAVKALSSAYRGEADPAEKYNLQLSQSAVNAELAAKGQDKLTGTARKQAETQARTAMIMRQSADATGNFAKESDTAAGQQARAAAATKNAMADLGAVLLPIVAQAAAGFAQIAQYVSENSTLFIVLAGVVGGLAVAIMAVNAALSLYSTIQTIIANKTKIAAALQWVWNAAMTANPIGIIIVAIGLLIAGFVLLYRNSETFRAAVDALWAGMKAGLAAVIAWFKQLGTTVATIARNIAAWFGQAWSTIKAATAAAVAFVKAYIAQILATARAVGAAISAVFSRAWSAIKAAAAAAVGFVRAYLKGMQAAATAVANAIKAVFARLWSVLKSGATTAANAVKAVFKALGTAIAAVATAIKSKLTAAFNAVKSAGAAAARAISAPFRALKGIIDGIIAAVGRLVDRLRNLKVPKLSFPKIPSGFAGASSASLARSSTATGAQLYGAGVGARTIGTPGLAGGPTIVIQGALDPEAVARQIERILGSATRRRSGVTLRQRAGTVAAPVGR